MSHKLLLSIFLLLSACSSSNTEQDSVNNDNISSTAKSGKLLSARLTYGSVTNAFQGQLSKATVTATVETGAVEDWVATGIVLAEKMAKQGIDMVEVTLDRNDLGGIQTENGYKHYVRVAYAPDIKRSIAFDRNWEIAVADEVVPIKMIEASNQYYRFYRQYLDSGIADTKADTKAREMVAKSFNLAADWHLPRHNLRDTKLSRNDFFIKGDPAEFASLNKIAACLKEKMNITIKACD